ncbi:twin-arginine translocase TatA/TatE family subunit [Polycladomyces subterraneus]|uniref:Sec-independent protein translocase protein TatA n=2 Tax=Polycladomyces subterraneus TaxID=1016997 RepID=A0ABT8IQM5_9BACL|nr:twin-arginine translocase TatA/TatE family subunit [Polycladomyces subterraneus]MDN4595101.1 twin-arginine translocase TatA/TatE family subunit [Polycladomyces subterraneus]
MPSLSGWIIILVIALLVFGPSKLPQLGKSLGSALREFKEAVGGVDKDDQNKDKTST